jgi:hypothetical protein
MTGALEMLAALTAAASIFVLIDWLGQRQDRRAHRPDRPL